MSQFNLIRNTTFRLIMLLSAFFGVSALIMFAVMYVAVLNSMDRQVDNELHAELNSLIFDDAQDDADRLVSRVQNRVTRHERPNSFYLVENSVGEVLAGEIPAIAVPFASRFTLPRPPALANLDESHELRAAGTILPNGLSA